MKNSKILSKIFEKSIDFPISQIPFCFLYFVGCVVYITVVYFLEFTAETLYFTSFIFRRKVSLSHFSTQTLYRKQGELSPAEFRTPGSPECLEEEVLVPMTSFGWKKLSQ